ncbi:hypothetical protein H2248_005542 [Termitomyces sp. 'cryptogamus']|nr:hypothetical protein H2248_005542 [Termitomyces sp. 'cryptogamus']
MSFGVSGLSNIRRAYFTASSILWIRLTRANGGSDTIMSDVPTILDTQPDYYHFSNDKSSCSCDLNASWRDDFQMFRGQSSPIGTHTPFYIWDRSEDGHS